MSEQFTVGTIMEAYVEDLVAVSNVRRGDLPGIDSLAANLKASGGNKVAIQATPLTDLVDAISTEIPRVDEQINMLKDNLDGIDDDIEAREIQTSVEKLEAKKETMREVLDSLLSIDEDEREDKLVIVDGHRRAAAAEKAELETLKTEIVRAKADPAELLLDQLTMGTTGANLTFYEEARAFSSLLDLNLTREEISARMGSVSRDHIRQRVALIPIVERAETMSDDHVVSEWLTKLDNNDLRSRYLNKVGMYHDEKLKGEGKQPLSDDDFVTLLDESMKAPNYNTFKNWCNESFGKNEGAPRQPKGPKDGAGGEGGEGAPRRRPDKELRAELEKQQALLALAEKAVADGSKEVSKTDLQTLRINVAALEYHFGGPVPSIPESMQSAAERYDALKSEEQAKADEAKKAEREKKSAVKKEEKAAEAAERKKVEATLKELYKAGPGQYAKGVKQSEKKIEKLNKTIEESSAKIAELNEEQSEGYEVEVAKLNVKIAKAEQNIEITESVLKTQRANLVTAEAEFQAKKPDWLIEKEAKAAERAAARAAKKAEEEAAAASEETAE